LEHLLKTGYSHYIYNLVMRMKSQIRLAGNAAVIGFCLTVVGGANAQISSINSAIIVPRVFNDVPGAALLTFNSYPSVTFIEQNVSGSGFANRDVWYFSNNGGASAYQFQANDYFHASFSVTLSGGSPGFDLEAGFLFKNPSHNFGGDLQTVAAVSGAVYQSGGPSYYPFSPAAGGYPGAGGSVPNYTVGQTYTMGLYYLMDPNTGKNAFEYSVNGQFAASSPGNPCFDLGTGQSVGSPGDTLGGYFQIGQDPGNPNNSGLGVFSSISIVPAPEPATLALTGLGLVVLGVVSARRNRI
jgi:PEP-CTERM motif